MPSASGVRIAGDDYQWLHAWRYCMEMLYETITGHSSNPVVAVGVEEPGVGNGDDVVLYRQQPPNTYVQVKYAVDHRTALGLDYLDQQDVLRKMVQAHIALTAGGNPAEMRLVTNRTIDPADTLLRDRDGRDGRLLPRAAQGGPQSEEEKHERMGGQGEGRRADPDGLPRPVPPRRRLRSRPAPDRRQPAHDREWSPF